MSRPMSHPMSKQEIMTAIVECAEKLGHAPSHTELLKHTKVSQRQIVKQFGTYTRALRTCNLERNCGGNKLKMEALFADWATVVRTLKKIPSKAEFEHLAKHSTTPLKTRFGNWGQVPGSLKRYIEDQGRTEECKDLLEAIAAYEQGREGRDWGVAPGDWGRSLGLSGLSQAYGADKPSLLDPRLINPSLINPNLLKPSLIKPRLIANRPVYGALFRPYPQIPLIHGPMNEAGVIYLFGTLAERLGYVVTRIQKEFPDCEAMRLVDKDRWQRVLIEFELESRNFVKHLHDVNGCDAIVCWEHNWPECPLEVIELRNLVQAAADLCR
jgi:hypothetical protein